MQNLLQLPTGKGLVQLFQMQPINTSIFKFIVPGLKSVGFREGNNGLFLVKIVENVFRIQQHLLGIQSVAVCICTFCSASVKNGRLRVQCAPHITRCAPHLANCVPILCLRATSAQMRSSLYPMPSASESISFKNSLNSINYK